MWALLVGLPDVTVGGLHEWPKWLRIRFTPTLERPSCCGRTAWHHGSHDLVMLGLPVLGRPTRLVWRAQAPLALSIFRRSWTEQRPESASARCALTTCATISQRLLVPAVPSTTRSSAS